MRLNSSKKIYTPKSLLGIEKCEPLAIKDGRCALSKNLLYRDGVLKKRNGWRQIHRFTDESGTGVEVYGMYKYMDDVIYHAGEHLYKNESLIESEPMPYIRSYGFEWNGLLYILCGGDVYIYDGDSLTNAYDSRYAYVPTTTESISPINMESTSATRENESIITSRRKNTLIGVSERYTKYLLDGDIDESKPVQIKSKIMVTCDSSSPYNAIYDEALRLSVSDMSGMMGINDDIAENLLSGGGVDVNLSAVSEIEFFFKVPIKVTEASLYARSGTGVPRTVFFRNSEEIYDTGTVGTESTLNLNSVLKDKVIDRIRLYGNYSVGIIDEIRIFGKRRYSGYVELEYAQNGFEFVKSIMPVSIKDALGKSLSLYTNDAGTARASDTVHFEKALNGECLIVFSYNAASDYQMRSNIEVEYSVKGSQRLYFKIGEMCKTDTGATILALSDGKRVCLSSPSVGFGYFPVENKMELDEITSLCMGEDGVLFIFGKDKATCVELTCKDGGLAYSLIGYSNQGGAVNQDTSKTVNFDTVSLSCDGIFGSTSGKSHRVRRGESIAKMIPEDISDSIAIEHNGCYYLFIDGSVYVADTRLKSYDSNRLDSDFQYEWWRLDNIPASCVSKINGEIYIGRRDGRVVTIHDGYSDIYYEDINQGSYLFDKNSDGVSIIYLDKALNIHAYDRILLSACYKHECKIVSCVENESTVTLHLNAGDLLDASGSLKIYPEMTVYLLDSEGEITEASISEADVFSCTVTVPKSENIHTYESILFKNQDAEYTLEAENDYYLLLDRYGEPATLLNTDNAALRLKKSTPVSVEYESAPLLRKGEARYLYGIEIELTGDSEGLVSVEYETDRTEGKSDIYTDRKFDLNRFAFSELSFNASLKKSHYIRTFERGFDYVVLKIKHDEACEVGLKKYGLIYA